MIIFTKMFLKKVNLNIKYDEYDFNLVDENYFINDLLYWKYLSKNISCYVKIISGLIMVKYICFVLN